MMKMRKEMICSIGFTSLVALAGCADATDPEPPADGWRVSDEQPEPADEKADTVTDGAYQPPKSDTPSPVECALEQYTAQRGFWVDPRVVGFSPNGGLFVSGDDYAPTSAVRVSDGEAFHMPDLRGSVAVSDDFQRAVYTDGEYGVHYREVATGDTLFSQTGDYDDFTLTSAISPDGSTIAQLRCVGEEPHLALVDSAGTVQFDAALAGDDGPCNYWGEALEFIDFSADGEVVVATTGGEFIWALDVTSGELNSRRAHQVQADQWSGVATHAVALSPVDDEVVTTGADGVLKRWSLPGLNSVGRVRAVGTFEINRQSYAPRFNVSPVAFGPEGERIAFVNGDGDIVVESGDAQTILKTPERDDEDSLFPGDEVPVLIRFSEDGSRLGVAYQFGTGIFGCPGGTLDRDEGALAVDVPAERTVEAGNSLSVVVDRPIGAASRVLLDGEVVRADWKPEGFTMYPPHESGTYDVTVEVDDGVASGSASFELVVE